MGSWKKTLPEIVLLALQLVALLVFQNALPTIVLEFTCAGVTFANFKTLSQEQVSELIKKAAKKSCPLDPMPTSVVPEVLDVLLPVITNMINLSFESGKFASD